jgi:hypothetical protein
MRRPVTPSPIAVQDALAALTQPGCPVCRSVEAAEERFFTWFAIETAADPPMIIKMRRSGGMCPAHTRRALWQRGARTRLTSLYREVLPFLRDRIAAGHPDLGSCPACQAHDEATTGALDSLRDALHDPRVRDRYIRADGLCIPHLTTLVTGATVHTAVGTLARVEDSLPVLAGTDTEAPLRARLRALVPTAGMSGEDEPHPATTLARLTARLNVGACPLCLAEGQAERRYLTWLTDQLRHDPADLAREPGGFCPTHLHDLAATDPTATAWAIARERADWTHRLTRLLAILHPDTPRRHDNARDKDAFPGDDRPMRDRVTEILERQPCLVCRAVRDTTDGESGLFLAALAIRPFAEQYHAGVGLCVRHLRTAGPRADKAGPLLREVATARLGLLAVELTEAARKSGWLARHEPKGPETTAWIRAAALLDGRAFIGGPPRAPD